ncbi:amino acid permease [Candidatus Pacearchaeota archaeon]|nr:amino acid permease [Candidatus Pacearchaeota archaeon]
MPQQKSNFALTMQAIAAQSGTIIGAGFLGMPYALSRSGFWIGFAYILGIGLIMLLVNLYYAEIILRTSKVHQHPGYAEKYFGKKWKRMSFIALMVGAYAMFLAYLIAEGQSLSTLFFGNTGYIMEFGTLFFILMSYLSIRGMKAFRKYELFGSLLVVLITLLLFYQYYPSINIDKLPKFNPAFIGLPFGIILFSFLGIDGIPGVRMILARNERLMKRSIIISSLIPIIVYAAFSLVVVGSFSNIPQIATLALGKLFIILGVLSMFTAYFSTSLTLKDSFQMDHGLHGIIAWFFAICLPYVIFLAIVNYGFLQFVDVLGIGGIVLGGFYVIMTLTMVHKAKIHGDRKPEFSTVSNWAISTAITLIFLAGIVWTIMQVVK